MKESICVLLLICILTFCVYKAIKGDSVVIRSVGSGVDTIYIKVVK